MTVGPAVLRGLSVAPTPNWNLPLGDTVQLIATGHWSNGDADATTAVTWTAYQSAIAGVDVQGHRGRVSTLTTGIATIGASPESCGPSASTPIRSRSPQATVSTSE